jgi:hypothetical protein
MLVETISEANESARKMDPYLTKDEQVRRRRDIYGAERPEKISIPELFKTCTRLTSDSGFTLEWSIALRRDYIARHALN